MLMAVLIFSCGSSKEEQLDRLKADVLAVHDEVMPKMGELRKVEKSLRSMAEQARDR